MDFALFVEERMLKSVLSNKNNFLEVTGAGSSLEDQARHSLDFVVENQLKDAVLWHDFVNVFRGVPDDIDDGWRGEYWGKLMRGATMCYECCADEMLYKILTDSVEDMLTAQDAMGRISSYSVENEFHGWDVWCRKYVMLGMEYFIDICSDNVLISKVILSLRQQADYIISKIGNGSDKVDILATSDWWGAMNSCSILEPFVRLYNLTSERRYLEFAEYIISTGFCDKINIIDTCYNKSKYPYQFPYTKAYEMMSCFEGLLEYWRVCGGDKYLTAAINFVDMVIESDVSMIGSCGCTHELFDNSYLRQTEPASDFIMQETCVTVTWMKLCYNLLKITGNSKYADCIERSGYNAMLGSINYNLSDFKNCESQTEQYNHGVKYIFDSYSPLYYDRRGKKIGGHKNYKSDYYYGCCNCIGAAGVAVLNKFSYMSMHDGGLVINNYVEGRFTSPQCDVVIHGNLNAEGKCSLDIVSADTPVKLILRVPEWLTDVEVMSDRMKLDTSTVVNGYITLDKLFGSGSKVVISGKIPVKSHIINNKIAYSVGAVVLARDSEDPNFETPIDATRQIEMDPENGDFSYKMHLSNGEFIHFKAYKNCATNFDDVNSRLTVWSNISKIE